MEVGGGRREEDGSVTGQKEAVGGREGGSGSAAAGGREVGTTLRSSQQAGARGQLNSARAGAAACVRSGTRNSTLRDEFSLGELRTGHCPEAFSARGRHCRGGPTRAIKQQIGR